MSRQQVPILCRQHERQRHDVKVLHAAQMLHFLDVFVQSIFAGQLVRTLAKEEVSQSVCQQEPLLILTEENGSLAGKASNFAEYPVSCAAQSKAN